VASAAGGASASICRARATRVRREGTGIGRPPREYRNNAGIVHQRGRLARLKREWTANASKGDKTLATLLAEAAEDGLKQREIAAAIGAGQSYVNNLWRYHRFMISAEITIPEQRFRFVITIVISIA